MWFNVRGTVLRLFRFLMRTAWIAIWQFICGMYGDDPVSTSSFKVGYRYRMCHIILFDQALNAGQVGSLTVGVPLLTVIDEVPICGQYYLLCVFVLYITTLLHLLGSHCLGVGCISFALFISLVFTLSFYICILSAPPLLFSLTVPSHVFQYNIFLPSSRVHFYLVLLRRQFQLH